MSQSFSALNAKADSLAYSDAHADAAAYYERALRGTGGSERQRILALLNYGRCMYFIGRFPEAFMRFNDVYEVTRYNAEWIDIAYYAYINMMLIYRWIIDITRDLEYLDEEFALIHRGISWLKDTHNEIWRAPLILEKAIGFGFLGQQYKAYDLAEEQFAIAQKSSGPRWAIGYHGMMVSRYARGIGEYQRCFNVLNKVLDKTSQTYSRVQILTECLLVLLESGEHNNGEMLRITQKVDSLTHELNSPRTKLEALIPCAQAYLILDMGSNVFDTLQRIQDIASDDIYYHRFYLLREAEVCFTKCLEILDNSEKQEYEHLRLSLIEWIDEDKKNLGDLKLQTLPDFSLRLHTAAKGDLDG